MHQVPVTTKVESSNPVHGEVYSIQQYVIKFASDLQQVGGFFWFRPPINLPRCYLNIVESGINHHNPNKYTKTYFVLTIFMVYITRLRLFEEYA
jgi:hypothetical protein